MLLKSKVLEIIEHLPNEFSMDDLFERMSFIESVGQGLSDLKEGRILTETELEKEMQSWFK